MRAARDRVAARYTPSFVSAATAMLYSPDAAFAASGYDDSGATTTAGAAASDSPPSQQTQQLAESYMIGFVLVNIVGLRYYRGRVNGREMVGLVREPLNPHDPNAIKVLNMRGVQVGHVERTASAVLAPLIDSRLVTVEGIVPKPPPTPNPFKLPCQVHVFSNFDAIDLARTAIESAGLALIWESNPEFGLSQSVIVQEAMGRRKKDDGRSIDEIFALVGKGDGLKKVAPVEPPKDVISAELFPHQKEGLGWLVNREMSEDLPPFWEAKDGGFLNVLTNHITDARPQPLKGGIFADDMGLGKTLTLLSLIATTRPGGVISSSGEYEFDSSLSLSGNKSKSVKKGLALGNSNAKRRKTNGGGARDSSGMGTTLVVCPPSVFSAWITQLEEHTVPGSLKVYMYHGERTREASELLKHDIVLTTYSILSTEFHEDSPLKDIQWFRVILDEAHLIKNHQAQQTKACVALKADRRWVVTGTPIQNTSFDLFSLMAFLKFEPFSIKSYWQSLVQRPLAQGRKTGMSRLQALMGAISLRRIKDENDDNSLVRLPTKTVETCFVNFSTAEREQYDQLESAARKTISEYIDAQSVMKNYSTVLHILLRLRQICDHVALCPADIKSLFPSNELEDVSKNPDLLQKLLGIAQDGDDFDCPVCLSPPTKTVITSCAHIFCQNCILKTLKHLKARCPMCRRSLSESDLFMVPQNTSDEDKGVTSDAPPSSKVSMLLKLLLATRENDPNIKSVIFSQFRKLLILLEEPLRNAGFTVVRLDGSMTAKKRTEVIKEFVKTGPSSPTVLLASLKAAGTGINLTAASRVYLMDPWWNPAVEEQAMDRVHRIGQNNEVKVVRLIVKDTVEERILVLQDKKKQLASGAFGKKTAKEQRDMRVEDIRTIMCL